MVVYLHHRQWIESPLVGWYVEFLKGRYTLWHSPCSEALMLRIDEGLVTKRKVVFINGEFRRVYERVCYCSKF